MVKIVSALKRPFSNYKNLLIGILINITPILNIWNLGYFIKCLDNELPTYNKETFLLGLQGLLISIIYFLPAILIYTIFYFINPYLSYVILYISLLITSFLLPAGYILLFKTNFKEAIKIRNIKNKITKNYILIWFSTFLISYLINSITIYFLGKITMLITAYILGVIIFTIFQNA